MKISLTFLFLILFFAFAKHGFQLPEERMEPASISPRSLAAEVEVIHLPEEKRVNILMDGQLFTSYIYPDDLEKPVLYPVMAPGNIELTRGFPLEPRAFERTDHPHHVGIWFNYGDVNGLDFWNNSYRVPEDRKDRYGTIRHREVVGTESGKTGELQVQAEWQNAAGETLLEEATTLHFFEENGDRIIDRVVTLRAKDQPVLFEDNKEGMIAIRVARELEFPSDKPLKLTDAQGKPQEEAVLNNEGVSGNYLSSEGKEGGEVWGTRAQWMKLYGEINDTPVAIAIIDHPQNPGYPTYWHARTYGLFAANTLGQKVFSEGKEALNYRLTPGEEVTFRYRMVFSGGDELTADQINKMAEDFKQAL
jgi:hypothetical protein